jgi:hypothetical protein
MIEVFYKIDIPKNFSEEERQIFLDLLKQQGKVTNPTTEKINRCSYLGFCKENNQIVSIGAIKPKTNSDFNSEKADLTKMRNEFQIELGYCFTLPDKTGRGYSSTITQILLDKVKDANIMASTELRSDNSMMRILERNGFKQYGKPWKSGIHKGTLGLYLKFIK